MLPIGQKTNIAIGSVKQDEEKRKKKQPQKKKPSGATEYNNGKEAQMEWSSNERNKMAAYHRALAEE